MITAINLHIWIYQLLELRSTLLIKDNHHLKTKVWKEHLGLSKFAEVQKHLEGSLKCRTRVEFKERSSNLSNALANRPKDVDYFCEYLDPKSIAQYKILEVRGSLGMLASSNAEV